MQIDDTLAVGVATAAVGIVSALWLWVRATVKAQIETMKAQLTDAIARIRELEESRLAEAKAYSEAYRTTLDRVSDALERIPNNWRHRSPLPLDPRIIPPQETTEVIREKRR